MAMCEKCKGIGLVPREGEEANADLHPLVSKTKGVCDACGGSGSLSPEDVRRQAIAAAKKADG